MRIAYPYSDELVALAKHFPNAYVDLCWVWSIDPYSTYYDGTSPMTLEIPGGGTWTVNNDEPGGGTMSLEEATWNSINVVYAQLDLDVGPENVTQTAHEMGIETTLQSVPAEAIGGLVRDETENVYSLTAILGEGTVTETGALSIS